MTASTKAPSRAQLAQALREATIQRDREILAAQKAVRAAEERLADLDRLYKRDRRVAFEALVNAQAAEAQIERAVVEASAALRANADPRIAVLRRNLQEFWDRRRFRVPPSEALALIERVRKAVAQLDALELAVDGDVDATLRRVMGEAGVTPTDLEGLWRLR